MNSMSLKKLVHAAICDYEAACYSRRSLTPCLPPPAVAESTVAIAAALVRLLRCGASRGVRVLTREDPVALVAELMAQHSGVPLRAMASRALEQFEWARLTSAAGRVAGSGINFNHCPTFFDTLEALCCVSPGSTALIDCRLLGDEELTRLHRVARRLELAVTVFSSQGCRIESR